MAAKTQRSSGTSARAASVATLSVYWDSVLVGHLTRTGGQELSFQYAETFLSLDHARQVSLSLPLQREILRSPRAGSWFANLLPEGEIRGHVARALGVSERNEFAILQGIGGECAGALQLLPAGAPTQCEGRLIPLPWDELEAKIASFPRPSLLALMVHEGGLRLSLAGAQDKLPVHYADGELALPSGDKASTHLLKISSGRFPDLVQNELYCMTLAREVGLPVPPTAMAPTRTPILLVERYDRIRQADGGVVRLHQEDFCQALGLPPELKYESEGGPSLIDMFAALGAGSGSPLPDKRALLQWVIFNFIIGNADAHAKNASFLIGRMNDPAAPRLAPFYDLVCTEAYDTLSRRLAQKIGGENRPKSVAPRHWERFARAIDVNPKYLRTVGLELCERIEQNAAPLAGRIGDHYAGAATLAKIVQVVGERTSRLRTEL